MCYCGNGMLFRAALSALSFFAKKDAASIANASGSNRHQKIINNRPQLTFLKGGFPTHSATFVVCML